MNLQEPLAAKPDADLLVAQSESFRIRADAAGELASLSKTSSTLKFSSNIQFCRPMVIEAIPMRRASKGSHTFRAPLHPNQCPAPVPAECPDSHPSPSASAA